VGVGSQVFWDTTANTNTMARPINTLLIFLFSLTLFGALLQSSGVATMLGIGTQLGATDTADDVRETAGENVPTGAPTGDTLFGLYNVLGGTLGTLLSIVNPGLQILNNAGVPAFIMEDFIIPIATVVKGLGLIFFLRGLSQ